MTQAKHVRQTLMAILVGVSFAFADEPKEKETITGIGIVVRRIEPGEFLMGSPETEEGRDPDVERQHRVRITKAFWIAKHETTVGQFQAFVDATGYKTKQERAGSAGFGYDAEKRSIEIEPKFTWRNTGFGDERHPVVNVDWDDAVAFCKWMGEREGKVCRLPSEAEWEYACRAGTTTRHFTGETEESLRGYANVADASFVKQYPGATWSLEWDDGHAFTAPVGSFKPNAWGLHDMHGNVWEWCGDWYASDWYEKSPVDDPKGPATGDLRTLRGGAFTNRDRFMRSADRDVTRPKYRRNFTGFRVVVE